MPCPTSNPRTETACSVYAIAASASVPLASIAISCRLRRSTHHSTAASTNASPATEATSHLPSGPSLITSVRTTTATPVHARTASSQSTDARTGGSLPQQRATRQQGDRREQADDRDRLVGRIGSDRDRDRRQRSGRAGDDEDLDQGRPCPVRGTAHQA